MMSILGIVIPLWLFDPLRYLIALAASTYLTRRVMGDVEAITEIVSRTSGK